MACEKDDSIAACWLRGMVGVAGMLKVPLVGLQLLSSCTALCGKNWTQLFAALCSSIIVLSTPALGLICIVEAGGGYLVYRLLGWSFGCLWFGFLAHCRDHWLQLLGSSRLEVSILQRPLLSPC